MEAVLIRPLYIRPIYQLMLTIGLSAIWGRPEFVMPKPAFFEGSGEGCPATSLAGWWQYKCSTVLLLDGRVRAYNEIFIPLVGLLVLVYLLYIRFVYSPTGRVCIAIRENENRALMLGYNTFQFKLSSLILSSFTAALAGLLHALYQPIVTPNVASLGFTVTALLILLIGGVGTLSGALVGAVIYRLLDFGLRRYMGESASFINGAIYVAFVLFIPFGIVGTWRLKSPQMKAGWKRLMERFG
jgi:ABC-type branched-subunit amino acid transport system permease subunit